MFKIKISPGDPEYQKKREIIPLLENIYLEDNDIQKNLVDFSGLPSISEEELGQFKDEIVLVSPAAPPGIKKRENVLAAYPWRHWSVVDGLRQFIKSDDAGDLVSFRVVINLPRKMSRGREHFNIMLLPEIMDLCIYIAGRYPREIHVNQSGSHNICFVLMTFEDNIVAEIDLNEMLPDTMEPIRFVRAHFTGGVFTNMPLGGDVNVEGSLFATNAKIERFVHEHMGLDKGDEIDNLYFRMIYDIINGFYESGTLVEFNSLQKITERCLQSGQPVKIEKDIL